MADPEPQPDQGLMDSISRTYEYAKARYGDSVSDWSEGWYSRGGYIVGGPVPVRISPDECLISATDARAMRLRCCRAGHPTPTSDCGRPDATIEPPADRHLS